MRAIIDMQWNQKYNIDFQIQWSQSKKFPQNQYSSKVQIFKNCTQVQYLSKCTCCCPPRYLSTIRLVVFNDNNDRNTKRSDSVTIDNSSTSQCAYCNMGVSPAVQAYSSITKGRFFTFPQLAFFPQLFTFFVIMFPSLMPENVPDIK